MFSLQQTINFAKPFVQYSPLSVASNNGEMAISTASMIRASILGAPMTYAWNRNEASTAITAGTQDYELDLTDFGFLEKATITDDAGVVTELDTILNLDPLAYDATGTARSNAIAVQLLTPYTSLTVRLLDVPQQNYTLKLIYQKIAAPFVTSPVESVSTPVNYPVIVQSKCTTGSESGEAYSITFNSPVTAGNTLVVFFYAYTFDFLTISDTSGNTWNGVAGATSRDETDEIRTWTAVANSNGATTINFGLFGAGGASISACVVEIEGTPALDTGFTTNAKNSGTTVSVGSRTAADNFELAIQFAANGTSNATFSQSGSNTIESFSTRSALTQLQVASAGSATPAVTANTSLNYRAAAISFIGAGGGNPTYHGTFPLGVYPVGSTVDIEGFTNPENNGDFVVVSGDGTTLVVVNPSAIDETTAATVTNPFWDPIPDFYKDVYNNLFLAEAMTLVEDPRATVYRVRGVSALFAKAQSLSDTQKNIFAQQWLASDAELAAAGLEVQMGTQAKLA